MTNLKSAHPHFVRCILPNETKTEGLFDVHLVLHQLHCNNILEGLRITRKGFTVRMTFEEFANRYGMLKKKKLTKQLSKEKSEEDGNPFQRKAEIIMKTLNVEPELYRIGSGKIFFKARVYGSLEELRVQTLSRFVSRLQAQIRRLLVQLSFKAELTKKEQEDFIRRNAQRYVEFKSWSLTRLVEMINNKVRTRGLLTQDYLIV
jgi:myosin protein heavy chain